MRRAARWSLFVSLLLHRPSMQTARYYNRRKKRSERVVGLFGHFTFGKERSEAVSEKLGSMTLHHSAYYIQRPFETEKDVTAMRDGCAMRECILTSEQSVLLAQLHIVPVHLALLSRISLLREEREYEGKASASQAASPRELEIYNKCRKKIIRKVEVFLFPTFVQRESGWEMMRRERERCVRWERIQKKNITSC